MRFYQNKKKEKKNHFAMISGILNFISFCVETMRSALESAVFETFKMSTYILLPLEST